jgi:arylsulfatase A-like enzyme
MDTHFPLTVPPPFDSHFPTLDGLPHADAARNRLEFGDPDLLGTREFEVYRSHTFALYDGGLRYIDAEVGRLVDHLKRSGLYERSVIVVAADHGQAFWDHGAEEEALGLEHFNRPDVYGLGHGHTLFSELIHVPLILHGAGVPRGRVGQQVRNIDIAPTILGLAGAADPRFEARGVDLLARLAGGDLSDLPAWSETRSRSASQRALRDGRHQYLRLDGREYLFDTAAAELVDVADRNPETVERLRRDFERMSSSIERAETGHSVVDEDVRRDLKALGYVQ